MKVQIVKFEDGTVYSGRDGAWLLPSYATLTVDGMGVEWVNGGRGGARELVQPIELQEVDSDDWMSSPRQCLFPYETTESGGLPRVAPVGTAALDSLTWLADPANDSATVAEWTAKCAAAGIEWPSGRASKANKIATVRLDENIPWGTP